MCNNEKSCITINCGCCGDGTGSTGFKQTVLYDGVINAVGNYQLTEDVNNYTDLLVIHSTSTGESAQYMTIPVSYIESDMLVCHGDAELHLFVEFNIDKTSLNVVLARGSYQIVKIIGRKY